MPLFQVSSGALVKITSDCFQIGSIAGTPLTFPVTYFQADGVTPFNLTGYAVELELFPGWIDGFTGSPLLTFTQAVQSHGQIVLVAASGLATFTLTAAGSLALARGEYAYRWVRKSAGVVESRTFYGRWRHRA